MMCLCALTGVRAQVVKNATKWWDGSVLYTATVDKDGDVVMRGVTAQDGRYKFSLSKGEVAGTYYLTKENPDDYMPVRGIMGDKVQLVNKEGMTFLAVRKKNKDASHILVMTPDNVQRCVEQEVKAEQEAVSDMLANWLMNTTYLSHFSKDELRLMRNEILARHGWKFQAKDLQDYFSQKAWYRPVESNSQIRLSIIEETNLQLIRSEEQVPDDERGYVDYTSAEYTKDLRELVDGQESDFPGGLADDGRGPDEIDGVMVYTVSSELDLLKALGNDRTIVIEENAHLNLSRVLETEALFRGYKNRRWCVDPMDIQGMEPIIVSESESDGQQLVLVNMKNLTIKGAGHSSVEVDPRYAFVFRFVNCSNIVIENLTMGHTEGGFCSGGVIGANVASHLTVKNCDLYGCGTYGLDLWETYDFKLINSNIHDCTYGIMQLNKCTLTAFEHCDFFNNREYTLIEGWGCNGVKFEDCRIFANWGDADLFNFDTLFVLNGCKIYHPKEHLGKLDNCKQTGPKTKFVDNPLDSSIEARKIGPDQQ
jgi:hypothetical protein